MDTKKYIASGILELYVYGSLTEKENEEIYAMLQEYPEIKKEVHRIESSLYQFSAACASANLDTDITLNRIKRKIEEVEYQKNGIIKLKKQSKNWPAYIGWAASIALLIGLFTQLNQNKELREEVVRTKIKNQVLEGDITIVEEDLKDAENLLYILRNKDIIEIPLNAQAVDPNAYATVYWNKEKNLAYIDVQGLPEPPAGKVYQVWSLKLRPLTPTSLGVLDDFKENKNKVFTVENRNASEAFGITLEPKGGSKYPSLEMLYALGTVQS